MPKLKKGEIGSRILLLLLRNIAFGISYGYGRLQFYILCAIIKIDFREGKMAFFTYYNFLRK